MEITSFMLGLICGAYGAYEFITHAKHLICK